MQYRNIKVRDMTMRWQEAGEGALDSGSVEYLGREGAGAHVVLVHGIPTCPRCGAMSRRSYPAREYWLGR
jgi:hypothetical protein